MSNGTPDRREGGPKGPPPLLSILALLYVPMWVLGAFAVLVFDIDWILDREAVMWGSVILLLLAALVLAREMGAFRARGS